MGSYIPRVSRRRVLVVLALLIVTPLLLFVVNGVFLASGETPRSGVTSHAAGQQAEDKPVVVKVMAWNIAKGFIHKGGISFEDPLVMAERVRRIAEVIKAEQPDLVFLSEAIKECTPCPADQVTALAEATGLHAWAFGENYNFGLPFYRVVGGNAVLSRWPLEPVANPSLAGRQPFYVTRNNRRVLWCAAQIGGRRVLLASIHNDSFAPANNLAQMNQVLDFAKDHDALLAGDFNARPDDPSIKLVRETGRYAGTLYSPPTFPADKPDRTIDFIFAPASWELLEHRVVETEVSDHRPVITVFSVSR